MSADDSKPWDDGADYYSTSADDERLRHRELDDCIEAELDDRPEGIEDAVSGGLTVIAWARDEIDVDAEAKAKLKEFVEDLCEELAENYGDGEFWQGGPTIKETEAFESVAMPAMKILLSKVRPETFSVVGERTFTPDELLAWVRKNNPEWLEETS
jgi:hypothetical protein